MIHPDTQLADLGGALGIALVASRAIPRGSLTWARDPLDQVVPAAVVAGLPPLFAQLRIRFGYPLDNGDYLLPWDDTRFMNHSCAPNCVLTPFGFEVAVRDIAPGEALTNDYAMLHLDEDERIDCLCGAPQCRGVVTWQDQPARQPLWDGWVRDVLGHAAAVAQPLAPLLPPGWLARAVAHYAAAGAVAR